MFLFVDLTDLYDILLLLCYDIGIPSIHCVELRH